jgi:hypothetical protein
MDVSKYIFTYPGLVKRYKVPYTTIKRAVENLNLGIKLGRWRFIAASELGELEVGIRALGHRLPANLPPIEELVTEEAPAQPAVASLEATS